MAVDYLALHITRLSAAVVIIWFAWNVLFSAPEKLSVFRHNKLWITLISEWCRFVWYSLVKINLTWDYIMGENHQWPLRHAQISWIQQTLNYKFTKNSTWECITGENHQCIHSGMPKNHTYMIRHTWFYKSSMNWQYGWFDYQLCHGLCDGKTHNHQGPVSI